MADFSTSTADHHAAPTGGPFETLIVAAGWLIVALVVIMTIRFSVRPGETTADHIKRRILRDEA